MEKGDFNVYVKYADGYHGETILNQYTDYYECKSDSFEMNISDDIYSSSLSHGKDYFEVTSSHYRLTEFGHTKEGRRTNLI